MTRLLEHVVKDILESEGVLVPARRLCSSAEEAVAAFEELGGAATDTRVHAHVVRGVEAEGETAIRDIQLV